MYVKIDIDKIKERFAGELARLLREGYTLKYAVALAVAESLKGYDWVRGVYYSEISLGEFVEGECIDGRDVDVLVETRIGVKSLSSRLEAELEEAFNEVLSSLAPRESRHKLLEVHVDDVYVRAVASAARLGKTPHNALPLFARE
ncbi:hypothetical protein [Thermofilum pendens]|uniref:Uncharacterized protein n=1 Tax=Thermofilum pendens (strain DSM 2475 / Hrk 5) TaxID=368408 RepID=A1RYQ9_THEPD|nr:hypothetical protein [Thermofilum pendens]ABL78339.1 hypothetical protein Tpen_0939 [Thermofilum pendens Hrk 5]